MRQPITFAWGNLVFGRDADDAWALYRVATESYAGLTASAKRDLLARIAGFAFSAESDFQILRVTRPWSVPAYAEAAMTIADVKFAHDQRLREHLQRHESELAARPVARPEAYLAVRLPSSRSALLDGPVTWLGDAVASLRSAVGFADARGLKLGRLDELLADEERTYARTADFLDCDRVTTLELQWLLRRAFSRGIAEPEVDPHWRPQALVVDGAGESEARFVPFEADVLRLLDAPIDVEGRALHIGSEEGDSFQAFLVLGALPEAVTFPGRQAELLFAPLESVGFPADAVVAARWIANDAAVALTRRKVIDADHAFAEESHGDHGPSAATADRPAAARELEEYLTGTERPPLLRATIGLSVSAPTRDQLEERVQQLRREYSPVKLHRPLGAQLELFVSHLAAQLPAVAGYEEVLLCEQLGAMVPTATHAVGADVGMYIGHTLSGSSQPVLFDVTEASRTSRPPAVLCSGTLGSGKTLTAELLAYQAFLAGSRVVTVDPKGDHRLDLLLGGEHVEVIELRPGQEDRGLLDPLRVGPPETRADLAYSFLLDVLPAPVPAPWQTEVRHAVDAVVAGGGRTCGEVLEALEAGNADARDAGRALRVHGSGGLLQLAFAAPGRLPSDPGTAQATLLRIASLTLPLPGTARSELTPEERIGQALLRLLATYALHLMGSDWSRHKVLVFDEAWMLLGDAAGRSLVQRINRLCRSQNATPILATQALSDVDELDNLIGAFFCFGVETEREAERVLRLLGMDAGDPRLRAQLQTFRRGRCFMRDYEGRVAPVQIDVVDEALLEALDTTPRRQAA